MLVTLVAFIASTTCAFATPKEKELKLNRGQVQSSSNELEKLTDSSDEKGKGKSDKKKEKKKKEIQIFIKDQVLVALEDGEEIYSFDIVTGSEGKETKTGRFLIFRKVEKYTSKAYGSEMPYTMFFTKDGKAIHGTHMATLRSYLHSYITDSVGSKGCVGLTDDNAKALFEWAPIGTLVVVMPEKITGKNLLK